MNKKIENYLKCNQLEGISIPLLSNKNALELIELLYESSIRIYGFDGFKISPDGKYQINQDFSRDYSRFSKEEVYNLVKEYFLKTDIKNIFYNISFDKTK